MVGMSAAANAPWNYRTRTRLHEVKQIGGLQPMGYVGLRRRPNL